MAYLDHAATTPVRPEARDAMLPWLGERTGNPSGAHRLAREARRAIDDARDVLADVCGFEPGDIVFTAGGTEADNLAVLGVFEAVADEWSGSTVACPATEHHAVLEPVEHLGGRVLRVDAGGRLDLDQLVDVLRADDIAVLSVMAVNNETGVVADLGAVLDLVDEHAPGTLVHTDAVQALAWLDLPAATRSRSGRRVDLLSLSAHKFGGPQGVGVLAVRAGTPLRPRLLGGGQERGRRSGTQNVAGIVGAAAAADVATRTRDETVRRLAAQRDHLADGLHRSIPGLVESAVGPDGDRSTKVAGNCHVCVPGVEAEALLVLLEDHDVYASAASSCASGAQDPSHVLAAMGVPRDVAAGSLRLSLGWSTTDADIDAALDVVPAAVARLRTFAAPSEDRSA